MRPMHLCGSLRGVDWDERRNTQDKDLDSFGPQETSSGNSPTCCLWLDIIMLMRESPHKPAPPLCLALEIVSSS